MKNFQIFSFVVLMAAAGVTQASGQILLQEDHSFSEIFIKAESDEVVTFRNQDSVQHNLMFSFKGGKHTMVMLDPGTTQGIEFNRFGVYDVRCDIHPEMYMTVFVPYVMKVSMNNDIYQKSHDL